MNRIRDRSEAGRELAWRLRDEKLERPLVVALPRGGVPVGLELARELRAPWDVLIVRKIGAPGDPEYGLGAVGENGIRVLDAARLRESGYTESDLSSVIRRERAEVDRRVRSYRAVLPAIDRRGRDAILVDDGAATGGTAILSARVLRSQGVRRLVIALGVAPPDTCRALERESDRVVVLLRPSDFYAVGQFYEEFDPVEDSEVLRLLALAARIERDAPGAATDAGGRAA